MSNAIKFSLPGGRIILETYDNEDHAVVEIKDNGIGIPNKMINHLFSAEKPTTSLGTAGEQGTGFGLPLARSFIDRFDGKIEVESRSADEHPKSHGMTFKIFLLRGP